MTDEKPLVDSQSYDIARKTVLIVPFVMRVMSAEMRGRGDNLDAGHMAVMGTLQYRPHTSSELAQIMSVSPPAMSTMITTMETRGWVVRRRSETDRRVVWIELTDQGRAILERSMHETALRIAEILQVLPPQEREILNKGLSVMAEAFETYLKHSFANM